MLAAALSHFFGTPVQVEQTQPMGGGCISDVRSVLIRSQPGHSWEKKHEIFHGKDTVRLVVKRNSNQMVSNFQCEAEGLQAISAANVIRVPAVHAVGEFESSAFLVLSHVAQTDRPASNTYERFGERLAELHQKTVGDEIGWKNDNFLGSARQINGPTQSWSEFVADRRIGYQIRWAVDQGVASGQLRQDCENVISRMPDLLDGREDRTSLIHGDLWSGNYLFDENNQPTLIDPAIYRGCREAEWGMIKLFGNCPRSFERAYLEHWPMPEGWERRTRIYLLYHLLNHLNLFGGSYGSGCEQTVREILRG